jgi:hypothetical protein
MNMKRKNNKLMFVISVLLIVVLGAFSTANATTYRNCSGSECPKTPCGTTVNASILTSSDWTTLQKLNIKYVLETDFYPAEAIGEATKVYNCHAWAWNGSSTSVWINDPANYIDSYKPNALNGNILTYWSCLTDPDSLYPTHSAVDLTSPPYTAESKWGNGCLMRHDWDNVPDGTMGYADYGEVHNYYISATPCCGGNIDSCD